MGSVAIIGASLAGLRAAETLRRLGHDGDVTLVGAEQHPAYDRPPLSKAFLAGRADATSIALRQTPYEDLALDLRLGVRAMSLDVAGRRVHLDDGSTVEFDDCVIATGATPRPWPGHATPAGVFTLRTIEDATGLRAALDAGPARVVVIGAGFIGAEVAATCRGRGLDVTVLEALPAPMVRGLGLELGGVCADLHRDHGVDLRVGVTIAGIEGTDRVSGVRLADGTSIPADVVVVGIGVIPTVEWLHGSGLQLDNGVVCDGELRAAPNVYAIGDVCRFPNRRFDNRLMRLEHWTNAAEQGLYVGALLAAEHRGDADARAELGAFEPVPFVWSDQFDVKIQCVGTFDAEDEMALVHGSFAARRFVVVFGRAGRLVGALGFSEPRRVMRYRRAIGDGASFTETVEAARASD